MTGGACLESHDLGGLPCRTHLTGGRSWPAGSHWGPAWSPWARPPGGPGPRSPTVPGRNGISTAKPKRGGSITFGIDTEEGGFDPTTARWDEGGFLYGRTVFDPLAIVTAAGQVEPYLAQSITSNPDFTVFTITLRSGINFHDGTPLNAAALQLNLQKQQASILTGPAFANIESIQVTGPLTVVITTKTPWEELPYCLAEAQTAYIAAPSMLNAPGGARTADGHGAVRLPASGSPTATSPRRPIRTTGARGSPISSSITFKPIIDPSSRWTPWNRAPSTSCTPTRRRSFGTFRHNTKWSYVDNSGAILGQPDVNCVMLNTAAPPFNNHNAAQGHGQGQQLHASTPRSSTSASTTPMTGLFLPGSPYYTKTAYPTPDPKGAAKTGQADREADRPAGRLHPHRHQQPLRRAGRRSSSSRSGARPA